MVRTSNTLKKIQPVTKDALIEIKNNLQGINSRVDEAEIHMSNLDYKETKNNQSEQPEKKRIQKIDDIVGSLWDNFKCMNICIIEVPEGEKRKQEIGNQCQENKASKPLAVKTCGSCEGRRNCQTTNSQLSTTKPKKTN